MKLSTNRKLWKLLASVFALSLIAASCGGGDDDVASGGGEGEAISIAIVAPSAKNDLAFSQSMVDSVNALSADVTLEITDGTFDVEKAAAAIRGYAEAGTDIVIAHGTQFGGSLEEIAPDFPETTFVWGTSADNKGLDNVYAYYPAADEGGYVLGTVAAQLTGGKIGIVGPVEAGDAVAYINGFKNGAEANGAEVSIVYTGSFGDVALAAETATALINDGADVLSGSAQMVVGAVGVASQNDVLWFGTQANQTELDPAIVVASQVYHWEVVLEQILTKRAAGQVGGEVFEINLANGGLVLEFNDKFELDQAIIDAAQATSDGVADGSISTGVN